MNTNELVEKLVRDQIQMANTFVEFTNQISELTGKLTVQTTVNMLLIDLLIRHNPASQAAVLESLRKILHSEFRNSLPDVIVAELQKRRDQLNTPADPDTVNAFLQPFLRPVD